LDQLDTPEKYPERFTVMLNTTVSPKDRPPEQKYPWDTFEVQKLTPRILFSDREELSEVMSDFGKISLYCIGIITLFVPVPAICLI